MARFFVGPLFPNGVTYFWVQFPSAGIQLLVILLIKSLRVKNFPSLCSSKNIFISSSYFIDRYRTCCCCCCRGRQSSVRPPQAVCLFSALKIFSLFWTYCHYTRIIPAVDSLYLSCSPIYDAYSADRTNANFSKFHLVYKLFIKKQKRSYLLNDLHILCTTLLKGIWFTQVFIECFQSLFNYLKLR